MKNILLDISKLLGKEKVLTNDLSLIAFGADAGCYQKRPLAVVKSESEAEVAFLLKKCLEEKTSLTFRAAGTSLSGQSISDSILLLAAGDKWSKVEVLNEGKEVRTQPGITGTRLNQILRPYNVQFGPDPASINSAMIGGIIANNASGMSCGTHANTYATIKSARIVFADGSILDTANPESRKEFEGQHDNILAKLTEIRQRILAKPELAEKIHSKYKIKNTCGYSMNSFVDFEDPFDILLHIMVGSEGTLGFISEATFATVPLKKERASAMIYFKTLEAACEAVPLLKAAGVTAIELMDRQALRSVEAKDGIPDFIKDFGASVSALLIDLEAGTEEQLLELIKSSEAALRKMDLERDFQITVDKKQILGYWKIRKGVFPSVGGLRKPGTAVIIEDVAVKMEHLTGAVSDMRKMLDDLDYSDAVIYGHALDGNLHFIFSQDFENPSELKRYETLISTLVKLIVDKYDGSLKAEHGTGINMAPFVEYEWGSELYACMKELKTVFDPEGILNPGVIINHDKEAHLKGFKSMPEIDESVDKCIECGFCEVSCLSSGFTLSARQRIVAQREVKRLEILGDSKKVKSILKDFKYAGDKTCAGDGLCSTSCPLDIDTGVYIRKLRNNKIKAKGGKNPGASILAKRFQTLTRFVGAGLGVVAFLHRIFGSRVFKWLTTFFRKLSFNTIPQWNKFLPVAVKVRATNSVQEEKNSTVVYFPSCINQTMGPASINRTGKPLMQITEEVLNRAGYEVLYPANMKNLCCGTPWESKGFFDIANAKSGELEAELLKISNNGEYPVLCDTSPCIYRMKKVMDKRLKLFEPVEFAHDFLINRLDISKLNQSIAFHITCSSTKMGLEEKFRSLAALCVEHPVFPEEVGCCGFAGDKGFTLPELNDWALRKLDFKNLNVARAYSNSRTCEIGLSKATDVSYESILYLIDTVSS